MKLYNYWFDEPEFDDYSSQEQIRLYQLSRMEWEQIDGTMVRVRDMTDSHIRNCINMLKRNIANHGADDLWELWIDAFEGEMCKREKMK